MFGRRALLALVGAACLLAGCTKEGEGGFTSSPPPPLSVVTTSLPGASQGQNYSATLAAHGGNSPYTWSLSGTNPLPSGLMLSPGGVLSGIPTVAGTFGLALEVEDSVGATVATTLQLDIAAAPTLVITTTSLPNAMQGQSYSTTVSASGGSGAGYMWLVNAATPLPAGLTLSPTGTPDATLSGTTATDGTFSIQIEVQDSIGLTATATLQLNVITAAAPIFLTGAALPRGQETVAYSEVLSVSGGVGPYQWAVATGSSLPPGLMLNGSTSMDETLSGTPSAGGSYSFTLEVVDSLNHQVSQTFSMDVLPPPDTWVTQFSGLPIDREGSSATWTGSKIVRWGGLIGKALTNMGDVFDPLTAATSPMTTANAPSARTRHSAVWTGTEVIVWGGYEVVSNVSVPLQDGGIYNPSTDTWTSIPATGAPAPRYHHSAVWTGTEMIVWGGRIGMTTTLADGAAFNPSTGQWRVINGLHGLADRYIHAGLWTGTHMIVWGGVQKTTGADIYQFDGGMYDPVTDTWMTIPFIGAAPAVQTWGGTVVWTGSKLLVWGFLYNVVPGSNYGATWDPGTGLWTAISSTNQTMFRNHHSSVWTGTELIVWGGIDISGMGSPTSGQTTDTGEIWDSTTDTWRTMTTTGAPVSATLHRAWWLGDRMLVWGGRFVLPTASGYQNTGGLYVP